MWLLKNKNEGGRQAMSEVEYEKALDKAHQQFLMYTMYGAGFALGAGAVAVGQALGLHPVAVVVAPVAGGIALVGYSIISFWRFPSFPRWKP